MSDFNKLTARGGLTKDSDNGVQPGVNVRGIFVPLDAVSHELRRQYHAASRRADKHSAQQAQLQAIAEAMLAEYAPQQAMKLAISQGIRGDHAVMKRLSGKK
jgi:hypothetical protein